MFVLKKTLNPENVSEKFVSNQQGVVTDFSPILVIATNQKSTSVVFSIILIHRIVIIDNNGEKIIYKFSKKDGFYDSKRRIFLNDTNVKAYFYPYREGLCLRDKKIEGFFIEHQL